MSRITRVAVTLAILVGSAAGMLVGKVERAEAVVYSYWVYVHPGGTSPDGVNDYLNCGWHAICLGSPNEGTGLDWANSHGEWVYYRSSSTNNAGYSYARRGLITTQGTTCRFTYVSQYRRSGTHDSTVRYQHTGSNFHGQQFYIWSGLYPTWTSREVGNTMNEPTGCQTTAAHLHQQIENGFNYWINYYAFPTMATCSNGCGDKPIFQQYQLGYYWQE